MKTHEKAVTYWKKLAELSRDFPLLQFFACFYTAAIRVCLLKARSLVTLHEHLWFLSRC